MRRVRLFLVIALALAAGCQPETRELHVVTSGGFTAVKLDEFSNDRNVAIVNELELAFTEGRDDEEKTR